MPAEEKKPLPGFDQARIETEVDAGEGEFAAEYPIDHPLGMTEGGEIVRDREPRAEVPPSDRGYRNLNE